MNFLGREGKRRRTMASERKAPVRFTFLVILFVLVATAGVGIPVWEMRRTLHEAEVKYEETVQCIAKGQQFDWEQSSTLALFQGSHTVSPYGRIDALWTFSISPSERNFHQHEDLKMALSAPNRAPNWPFRSSPILKKGKSRAERSSLCPEQQPVWDSVSERAWSE